MEKILASPNKIIWEYFDGLRRLVAGISSHTDKERKQEIALSIFLAVAIVESFLNMYSRVIIEEMDNVGLKEEFLRDLESRKPLDYKIKKWPKRILGTSVDLSTGVGRDFVSLKEKRNTLTHFVSSHEQIEIENILIKGLADISVYNELTFNDAQFALKTAEGILEEIFRCRGIKKEDIPHMMHQWAGKVPV